MSVHQFTIDSDNLFPNRRVDTVQFAHEIQSGIAATLTSVAVSEGNCVVTFVETLSDAQVLALEALVFAHAGAPLVLETTGFTTTSTSYVAVPNMSATPPAGSYHVRFSGSGWPQSNNKKQSMAIYKAGALVAGSERSIKSGGAQTAGMESGFSCEAVVTVNGSQSIEARLKSDASGSQTAEIFSSSLMIGA
jgi:hypothetical protein